MIPAPKAQRDSRKAKAITLLSVLRKRSAEQPIGQSTQTTVARIGSGNKLHPVITVDSQVLFACHCPATRNGQASVTWLGSGTPTCGQKG